MNEVEQLAQEFYDLFKAVEEVIPDLSKYFLSAQQPSWLPLKKGGSVSMRDYILIKWSKSQQQKKSYLDKDLLLT